jgi:hypothetical protein
LCIDANLISTSKKYRKNLASGFEAEKQAVFGQTRPFFEFDAAHRMKKMPKYGQKLTFYGRNTSG